MDHAVRLAREAVKTNRCVVIGLQSTGEARTLEQLEKEDGELSDFVSTAKGKVTMIMYLEEYIMILLYSCENTNHPLNLSDEGWKPYSGKIWRAHFILGTRGTSNLLKLAPKAKSL